LNAALRELLEETSIDLLNDEKIKAIFPNEIQQTIQPLAEYVSGKEQMGLLFVYLFQFIHFYFIYLFPSFFTCCNSFIYFILFYFILFYSFIYFI